MNIMQFGKVFYCSLLICALPAIQSVQINVKGRMKFGEVAANFFNQLSEYLSGNRDQSNGNLPPSPSKLEIPGRSDQSFVKQHVNDEVAANFFNQLSEYLNGNRDQSNGNLPPLPSKLEIPGHSDPNFVKLKEYLDKHHPLNEQQSEELDDFLSIQQLYKWMLDQIKGAAKEGTLTIKQSTRQLDSEQPVQVFGNAVLKKWVDGQTNYHNEDTLREANDWGHLHVYGDHGKKGGNVVDVRRYVIYKD